MTILTDNGLIIWNKVDNVYNIAALDENNKNNTYTIGCTVKPGEQLKIQCVSYYDNYTGAGIIFSESTDVIPVWNDHISIIPTSNYDCFAGNTSSSWKECVYEITVPEKAKTVWVRGSDSNNTKIFKNKVIYNSKIPSKTSDLVNDSNFIINKKLPVICFDFDEIRGNNVDSRFTILKSYGFTGNVVDSNNIEVTQKLVKMGFDISPYIGNHSSFDYVSDTNGKLQQNIIEKMSKLKSYGLYEPIMISCSGHKDSEILEEELENYNVKFIRARSFYKKDGTYEYMYPSGNSLIRRIISPIIMEGNRTVNEINTEIDNLVNNDVPIIMPMMHAFSSIGGSSDISEEDYKKIVIHVKNLVDSGLALCMNMKEYYQYRYPNEYANFIHVQTMANNARLEDICNGYDDIKYDSPGNSVRTQISAVELTLRDNQEDILRLCGHIHYHSYEFGAINSLTNENTGTSKTRIRSAYPIPLESAMRLQFNTLYPTMFIWLNSNNERIGASDYISTQNIILDNFAPENTSSFRFCIKYDNAGTQEFTDEDLSNISNEIEIVKNSFVDDILESKTNLLKKVNIEEISIMTKSDTSVYVKNIDFSIFSAFLADSNRYVSDYEITKECFLTALTVPTNAATACRIICGEVKNNVFTIHHDYGNFTITDGTALINDTRYVLKPGERLFVRLTGGYHYKAQNNDCIFLSASMVYSSTEHYIIGYDLLLTDAEDSLEWIHNCSDMISSFRGKNYVAYGDSITAGYDLDGYDENRQFRNTSVNVYSKLLADDLKMNYFNYGYSAHGYSVTPNYTLVDLIERHYTDADVVTVAMGTNDYGLVGTYSIPFGTIDDTTTAIFCGSVRASYDKLLEYYPKAEIIIILPLPRRNMSANAQGKTLYDYADVIKQIAREYGFPVVDLLREGNVHHKSTVFMNEYSMDGLHWNESFHKEYIYPQLKNAVINHAIAKP